MKGYKVFNGDWTCRDKQYTCPGYFEEDVKPYTCKVGMHFCPRLVDCFNYYSFNPDNRVAEVEAVGDVDISDETKFCTNKLMIIREIPWDEVLRLVNTGKNCTGRANTGDHNAGDWNTGEDNAGDYNTGEANTGSCNAGDCNIGDMNTGYYNIGDYNAGNYNSGNSNSGVCNSGKCNTGNYNTGNFNTGSYNTGGCNTGDWNFADRSTGCFCTEVQHIKMFDKETNWTIGDWYRSKGNRTMLSCPQEKGFVKWILEGQMSDEEKEDNPTYKTTGGYLKVSENCKERQKWWDNLEQSEKQAVYELPNFDAKKFYICTGIKVDGHEISGE